MGYKITSVRETGEDPVVDMVRFAGSNPMIFDVGANGQKVPRRIYRRGGPFV